MGWNTGKAVGAARPFVGHPGKAKRPAPYVDRPLCVAYIVLDRRGLELHRTGGIEKACGWIKQCADVERVYALIGLPREGEPIVLGLGPRHNYTAAETARRKWVERSRGAPKPTTPASSPARADVDDAPTGMVPIGQAPTAPARHAGPRAGEETVSNDDRGAVERHSSDDLDRSVADGGMVPPQRSPPGHRHRSIGTAPRNSEEARRVLAELLADGSWHPVCAVLAALRERLGLRATQVYWRLLGAPNLHRHHAWICLSADPPPPPDLPPVVARLVPVLREALSDGPRPAKDVIRELGADRSAVHRARTALRVQITRRGQPPGQPLWALP